MNSETGHLVKRDEKGERHHRVWSLAMNRLFRLFMHKDALVFFVKHGEPEPAKTRLSAVIGKDQAAALYNCFIADMMHVLKKIRSNLYILYFPEDAGKILKKRLHVRRGLIPQQGEDLGMRMYNALMHIFEIGYEKVVLLGSDIPDLTVEIVKEAFAELDRHDAVLGPSEDGGYYCIGFREGCISRVIFENIQWSTRDVLDTTVDRMSTSGCTYYLLPTLNDIDTIYDLRKYFERSIRTGSTGTVTMKYMMDLRGGL